MLKIPHKTGKDTTIIYKVLGKPDAFAVPPQYGQFTSGNEKIMIYWWRSWRDFVYIIICFTFSSILSVFIFVELSIYNSIQRERFNKLNLTYNRFFNYILTNYFSCFVRYF